LNKTRYNISKREEKTMSQTIGWSTNDEIEFLNGIGTFGITKKDPLKLLKGYLYGIEERTDWGRIEKDIVIAHAEKLIIGLTKKGVRHGR